MPEMSFSESASSQSSSFPSRPPEEDPLPFAGKYTAQTEYRMPSTIGELVVTDERDPFIWFATIANPQKPLTEDGKHLMWAMYRAAGYLPDDPKDLKTRDFELMDENLYLNVSENDLYYAQQYQKHLDSFREKVGRHAAPEEMSLYVPNPELVRFVCLAAAQGIQGKKRSNQNPEQ